MKCSLFILIFIVFLIGCKEYQKENQQKVIDEKIESELASLIRNDTIFLGLRFGMSKSEFNSQLKKLLKEDKIYFNEANNYEYEFSFGDDELSIKGLATFGAEYFNDKLYKFSISVKPDGLISNPELIQLRLVLMYGSKYGHSYLKMKSLINDNDNYIWIDGNRMIELIEGFDDARIFYTDLIAEREKKEFENKKSIEKIKTIKEDI